MRSYTEPRCSIPLSLIHGRDASSEDDNGAPEYQQPYRVPGVSDSDELEDSELSPWSPPDLSIPTSSDSSEDEARV